MPGYVSSGFAPRHRALWDWVWAVTATERPQPYIGIWPRGGGKSTTAELATAAILAGWGTGQPVRRYGWIICETQDQADDHVSNVATILENLGVERMLSKYGSSKGWRRNRLRTADGANLDALGLDVARRGAKLDDVRPDWLVLDDLDGEGDSEEATEKKVRTLTKKLLPAAAPHAAILAIQNLVTEGGIFAQLADDRADFLNDRIVDGPHPAITDCVTIGEGRHARIVAGVPTWGGQDLAACQSYITTWGLEAFKSECQHEVGATKRRFLPDIALWDLCAEDLPPLDGRTPAVLALDAAVWSDGFAAVLVSRHPANYDRLAVRHARLWMPEDGQPINQAEVYAATEELCKAFNIVQIAYDPYQLEKFCQDLNRDGIAWCEPFSQQTERLIADKFLLDQIIGRGVAHAGDSVLRSHIDHADRRTESDRRIRIVKRTQAQKIDLAVALAMAAYRMSQFG